MTYSANFRQHILSTKKDENLSFQATATRFKVAKSTLVLMENDQIPKNTRNKKPTKIPDEKLPQDVQDYPDAFHYERAERLDVSQRGISDALRRLKITRKKRRIGTRKRVRKNENSIGP